MSWRLDDATSDKFQPDFAGWTEFRGLYGEHFPECRDRPMVVQRDFWVRGTERLIVEWDNPWVTVRAVILNGRVMEGPMTADEFNQTWERSSE